MCVFKECELIQLHWITAWKFLYQVKHTFPQVLGIYPTEMKTYPPKTYIYMEFRKMVTITLYTRKQKRHWYREQSFGLCGRGRGWDDLGEWHWNMYNIIYETSRQSRFDVRYWMLGTGALGWPRGMVWGGRWERGSGVGTRVHPWCIHVDVWQNQYNIVK